MPKKNLQRVKLDLIRVDGGTQQRATVNDEHIGNIAEAIRAGVKIEPGIGFDDGEEIWLGDGHHRWHGHKRADVKTMLLEVRRGSREDAILYSVGANAENNALRRTNADKRVAVQTLLNHAEWSKWSNREIARRAGVTHTLVNQLRNPSKVETASTPKDHNPRSEAENEDSAQAPESNSTATNSSVSRPALSPPESDDGDGDDDPQPPKTPTPTANPVPVDVEGHPLPNRISIREAFRVAGEFDGLMTAISQVKGRAGEIIDVAAVYLDRQQLTAHLNNARSELNDARPHAVCPYCSGASRGTECQACRGCGWVKRRTWEAAPADLRAKLGKGVAA